MKKKLIITVAPTGNVPTQEMNPHLPVTPQEIADQVYECWKKGSCRHIMRGIQKENTLM